MQNKDWWQEASIYQVYPRSFKDTNGDGEGDLKGVITKLPYLKDLGVDAIWLSPFYTSPNKDGGYDVANPRDVDSRFGTLADAVELIEKTHELGLRIIVDIVPNHFSTEHIWFKEALNSPKDSAARKRFHFYDGRGLTGEIPPNNWCSIFGGPAWSRVTEMDGSLGQWYLHLFDSTQADLNWNNLEVAEDFEKTLRFWLDLGVDGFRIDVAHGLVKDEIHRDHRDPEGLTRALRLDVSDMPQEQRESLLSDVPFFDREGVHEIYRSWRKILDSYPGERMSVAEAWVHPSSRAVRYVRADELHQIFNFDFLIAQWNSEFLINAIDKTLQEVAEVAAPATWVLCNHDSPRLVSRLGGGKLGLRKARAMALLTHALPGGVYIYQGEELGLEDAVLPDEARQDPVYFRTNGVDKGRDGARVPLPWDSKLKNYGFTTGEPWLPMPDNWQTNSVDQQQKNFVEGSAEEQSQFGLYQESLKLRKNLRGLSFSWIEKSDSVLAFSRGGGYFVFTNTTDGVIKRELPRTGDGTSIILSSVAGAELVDGHLTLPAHSTVWLQTF
ncbi:MAG: glycoside hydrolase family 13 protein [Candidatus Nanopelagicaceae bacterium]|nr:glycoside hydrolase family 13 protein [Candidatus Nanopelagicaceae bacterium]